MFLLHVLLTPLILFKFSLRDNWRIVDTFYLSTIPGTCFGQISLGALLGVFINHFRDRKIPMFVIILGWLTTFGILLMPMYIDLIYKSKFLPVAVVLFHETIKGPIWGLAICWIIWACHSGYGSILNDVLSAKVFIVLNRLVLAMYLVHEPVMLYYFKTMRQFRYFSTLLMVKPPNFCCFY